MDAIKLFRFHAGPGYGLSKLAGILVRGLWTGMCFK